jgi:hypothetical protein
MALPPSELQQHEKPIGGVSLPFIARCGSERQNGGRGQEPATPPQSPAFAPEEFRPSGFSERHCEDQSGKAQRPANVLRGGGGQ